MRPVAYSLRYPSTLAKLTSECAPMGKDELTQHACGVTTRLEFNCASVHSYLPLN